MSLDNDNRKAVVSYRLEKADTALEDADFLKENGKNNLAANRLYYALYYASSALLISHGIPSHKDAFWLNHSNQSPTCKDRHSIN